jgi:hypothetical protein
MTLVLFVRHCEPEGTDVIAAPFGLATTSVLFGGSGDFDGQEFLTSPSGSAKSISYADSPPRKITVHAMNHSI